MLTLLIRIASLGITVPIWLIVAAGLWIQFDKGSEVRTAVNRAVTELTTGAELEASQAKVQALEKINSELQGRAAALDAANGRFSDSLEQAQTDLENANAQLVELNSIPVNNTCSVDNSLFDKLRSR